jgi:hypothetical protein
VYYFFSFYLLPLSGRFLQGSAASGHFPLRRAQFSFACSNALSGHFPGAQCTFFCLLPLLCAPNFFLSLLHCFAQRLRHGRNRPCATAGTTPPDARYLHASGESFSRCACRVRSFLVCAHSFFVLSGQQQGCACRFFLFVLSGHLFSSQRAQIFLGHFCSARALAMHACQGCPFFSCPVTSSSCAQI